MYDTHLSVFIYRLTPISSPQLIRKKNSIIIYTIAFFIKTNTFMDIVVWQNKTEYHKKTF